MTTRQIVDIQEFRRNHLTRSQRERELEVKNERLQRLVTRLLAERVKYCPSCDRHYEPVEGVRS